ncbi:MAG: Holliday junction branch migration protein RuvA [Rhodocyclaceae bacterium]|nr:Holliday junction branch migration protein RuvA [Rhodocyclaceae bacterium]
MIGRLHGTLVSKHPPLILVDVGGVGYELEVPMSTFYHLPECNHPVSLLTHLVVREDAHLLYGFLSEAERAAFRQLLKISGIGAKLALAVLSGLSVEELAHAVARQETGRLTKIPGIGKKTAERLLLELKGKFSTALPVKSSSSEGAQGDAARQDILGALLALGYSEREAAAALAGLPEGVDVAAGIRLALKSLARS